MRRIAPSLLLLVACHSPSPTFTAAPPPSLAEAAVIPEGKTPSDRREIIRAAVSLFERGELAAAAAFFENTAANHPVLADHALRFLARIAEQNGDRARAIERWRDLEVRFPDSIWRGEATLALARAAYEMGNRNAAQRQIDRARTMWLPEEDSASALWLASRIARETGQVSRARDLAVELRARHPASDEAAQARAQAWEEREAVALSTRRDAEGEIARLLSEGAAPRALDLARSAILRFTAPRDQAPLLWLEARAIERSQGRAAAEPRLEELRRRFPDRPEAAQALHRLATIAWNRDDDGEALRRFETYVRSYPSGPMAAESLYAAGRIHQEARQYPQAIDAFERLIRRYPAADLAPEAAWRIGWCDYRAGRPDRAARAFATAASRPSGERPAALYWRARALEAGAGAASPVYEELLRRFPESYYSGLAEARLGRPSGAALRVSAVPEAPPLATGPGQPHAQRYAELRDSDLKALARLELAAHERQTELDPLVRLRAWSDVDGFREAVRGAARRNGCDAASPLARYCYPRAFWSLIQRESERFGVDPDLVLSLIRQESLFDPHALSPADARGLMQLLPSTAARTARAIDRPEPSSSDLFQADRNVEIGTAHLRELLDRYGGSEPHALAAYNAGAAAVEKWQARYPGLADDEFVDSITYRETRDYVKKVLQNRRIYRALYDSGLGRTELSGNGDTSS